MRKQITILLTLLSIFLLSFSVIAGGGGGETAEDEWMKHPYHKPKAGNDPKVTFNADPGKTVNLENRGGIVSKFEFTTFKFECGWKWKAGGEQNGVKYWDTIGIGFHSTGEMSKKWPHEMVDGVLLSANPASEMVVLSVWENGELKQILASEKVGEIKKNTPYLFDIDCTGDFAIVRMGQDTLFKDKWIHGAVPLPPPAGKRMMIYNREGVGGFQQESDVWDLVFQPWVCCPPCCPPPPMAMLFQRENRGFVVETSIRQKNHN